MKNTTMCALRSRGAFARSSGRISSTDAPVVPIKLASTAPIAEQRRCSTSGVPESEPRTWMPPRDHEQRAEQQHERDVLEALLEQLVTPGVAEREPDPQRERRAERRRDRRRLPPH